MVPAANQKGIFTHSRRPAATLPGGPRASAQGIGLIAVMRSLFLLVALLATLLLARCDEDPGARPLRYTTAPPAASQPSYRFAVHPLHNPKKLSAAYQPLIDQLNRKYSAARFELEASRDYQAYE